MVPIYYFSAQQIGSVTEQVAHKIGQVTASVPIRIQVTPKYPNDWHQLLDRVQAERAWEQPLTVHPILVLSQAEPLLICYPNWQNHLPPAVTWWLRRLEIKGPTIYPVCVHEGSGMGDSEADIKQCIPAAKLQLGLPIRASRVELAGKAIEHWLVETHFVGANISTTDLKKRSI